MHITEVRINTLGACLMIFIVICLLVWKEQYEMAGGLAGTIGVVATTFARDNNGHSPKEEEEGEKK